MGRTMPSECEHGAIWDWGDFGDEDSTPERCEQGCNDWVFSSAPSAQRCWYAGHRVTLQPLRCTVCDDK